MCLWWCDCGAARSTRAGPLLRVRGGHIRACRDRRGGRGRRRHHSRGVCRWPRRCMFGAQTAARGGDMDISERRVVLAGCARRGLDDLAAGDLDLAAVPAHNADRAEAAGDPDVAVVGRRRRAGSGSDSDGLSPQEKNAARMQAKRRRDSTGGAFAEGRAKTEDFLAPRCRRRGGWARPELLPGRREHRALQEPAQVHRGGHRAGQHCAGRVWCAALCCGCRRAARPVVSGLRGRCRRRSAQRVRRLHHRVRRPRRFQARGPQEDRQELPTLWNVADVFLWWRRRRGGRARAVRVARGRLGCGPQDRGAGALERPCSGRRMDGTSRTCFTRGRRGATRATCRRLVRRAA